MVNCLVSTCSNLNRTTFTVIAYLRIKMSTTAIDLFCVLLTAYCQNEQIKTHLRQRLNFPRSCKDVETAQVTAESKV